MDRPYIINFQHTGVSSSGFLNIAEIGKTIPFDVKRVFWTHAVPNASYRGFHAHKETCQLLVAIQGRVLLTTEMPNGDIIKFELNSAAQGVYLPPHVWHHMQYFENAVQFVMCSSLYNELDYLRDYNEFKNFYSIL